MVKAFRHPVSGAIVVCNAGAHTGVYHNPPVNVVAPDWLASDLPGFISPVPNEVGDALFLHFGTPIPSDARIEAEIGLGTHTATTSAAGDYSGPVIRHGETILAAWLGYRPVAKFTVSTAFGSRTLYVPAGVAIEESVVGEDPFPAALTGLDWTAEEVKDAAPAGRRRVQFLRSIPAAPGFELVLYSGNGGPDTQPGPFAAVMTPPDPYTTVGTLPIGSACTNRLWWRRINGGALGNPSNTVSFSIDGLSTTPTEPPPDPTGYDVIVSSLAAARSAIIAKINAGFSGNGDYIIGLNVSTSGVFDLTSLQNSHATATGRRIFVQHVGTFTDGLTAGCTVRHTGPVRIVNSRGIWLRMMHLRVPGTAWGSNNSNALQVNSSTLCGVTQCRIECRQPALSKPSDIAGEWTNGCSTFLENSQDITFTHNLLRYCGHPMLVISVVDGLLFGGNIFDLPTADDSKGGGTLRNVRFERNWFSRRFQSGVPGDPHEDGFQHQGTRVLNSTFWGNACLNGHLNKGARQMYWHEANNDLTGTRHEHEIVFITADFIGGTKTPAVPGQAVRYCALMIAGDPGRGSIGDPRCSTNGGVDPCYQDIGGARINGFGGIDFNYGVFGGTFYSTMVGPNGLLRAVGNHDERNYSAMTNDFEFGIPWMNSTGTLISESSQVIKAFRPKTGSRLHWGSSSPVGPYLRFREIFDPSYRTAASAAAGYSVMPNVWPVLGAFREVWNHDGYVTDGWTGAYTAVSGLPA